MALNQAAGHPPLSYTARPTLWLGGRSSANLIDVEPDHALLDGLGAAREPAGVSADIEHAVMRLQVRALRTVAHFRSPIRRPGDVSYPAS